MGNSGLRRRFRTIKFENYSPDDLIWILQKKLVGEGYETAREGCVEQQKVIKKPGENAASCQKEREEI